MLISVTDLIYQMGKLFSIPHIGEMILIKKRVFLEGGEG